MTKPMGVKWIIMMNLLQFQIIMSLLQCGILHDASTSHNTLQVASPFALYVALFGTSCGGCWVCLELVYVLFVTSYKLSVCLIGLRRMFGANDQIPMLPNSMPYNSNAIPPMQLDVLHGCNPDIMNMVGEKHTFLANQPDIMRRDTPIFSQDKVFAPSYENVDVHARRMMKQIPVSTGLKLSYGEDEPNSTISSAGESMTGSLSSLLSHNDKVQTEFARQNNEFDQYIRIQEENIRKGITELKHRHAVSLLYALEKELRRRMHEKDVELQNLIQKNKELTEKIRQITVEAQSWHLRAKQNESLINVLKNNINQAFLQGGAVLKEGYGESLTDDAASSCYQNLQDLSSNHQNGLLSKELVHCKACMSKEVSVLMLPCRHLCLCTDCDVFIDICPICRVKKAGSLQVYFS